MYDLGEMGKSYDAEKQKSKYTRKLPDVEVNYEATLKRVTEEEGDQAGKYYQFLFVVTKSNCETVLEGSPYVLKFYHGASKVDREKCWRKLTPLMLATMGKTNQDTDALAQVANTLGEYLGISRPAGKTLEDGADLDMPFRCVRKRVPARPDKSTGKVPAEFLDENGSPKIHNQDDFYPSAS